MKKIRNAHLTPREAEVFLCIVERGFSHGEIAKKFQIAPRTAKLHAMNILRKFKIPDRMKLIVAWFRGELYFTSEGKVSLR